MLFANEDIDRQLPALFGMQPRQDLLNYFVIEIKLVPPKNIFVLKFLIFRVSKVLI